VCYIHPNNRTTTDHIGYKHELVQVLRWCPVKACKVSGPLCFVRKRDGIEVDNLADRVPGDLGAGCAT